MFKKFPAFFFALFLSNFACAVEIINKLDTVSFDDMMGQEDINSSKAKFPVFEGEFNAAGQLTGGLHTTEAADKLIAKLPAEVQLHVSREVLSNGVERVVFREVDDILSPGAFKATARAAEEGVDLQAAKLFFRNRGLQKKSSTP